MKRVTVIRTQVVECSESDAQRIVDAGSKSGLTAERLTIRVETLLPQVERRIVIFADELDYEHGDYESDEDRKDAERTIECHGVWGFDCEQRDVVGGEWDWTDSCGGFIGGHDMEANMREHMGAEWQAVEMIDIADAKRNDWEEQNK